VLGRTTEQDTGTQVTTCGGEMATVIGALKMPMGVTLKLYGGDGEVGPINQ
jgi:hypothetical protein